MIHDFNTESAGVHKYILCKKRTSNTRFDDEYKKALRWICSVRDFDEGNPVLDVGCGIGWFLTRSSKDGFLSLGIDVNPQLIRVAKQYARAGNFDVGLAVCSAESLPYRSDFFGLVVCSSLLEHVNDWKKTLSEAQRVLRPEGVLFIVTTNKMCPITGEVNIPFFPWLPKKLRRLILRRKNLCCPAQHWFSYREISGLLRSLGFKTHDVLELVSNADLRGIKKIAGPLLPLIKRQKIIRHVAHFFMPALIIVATKVSNYQMTSGDKND